MIDKARGRVMNYAVREESSGKKPPLNYAGADPDEDQNEEPHLLSFDDDMRKVMVTDHAK